MTHLFFYILSLISLSQSPNIVRLSEAPADIFGFWRLSISAIILLPFAVKYGKLIETIKHRPSSLLICLVSGAFFYFHLWTFFYAAKNTSIANGMIIYATNPLFTALGAYLFFKEKFTFRLGLSYFLAIIGIFILVKNNLNLNWDQIRGEIAALLSALLFAGYILSGKKARAHFSNFTFSTIIYFTAGLFFATAGLLQHQDFFHYSKNTWLGIMVSICFPTFLGHALFTYLMRFMNINLMTLGKIVEPVISSFIAYFLFNEKLNSATYFSFLFVALALVILFIPISKTKPLPTSGEDI